MSSEKDSTLQYLRNLQHQFTDILLMPLDRSAGTLRATVEAYPLDLSSRVVADAKGSGGSRLAIYHRQYWYRLFGVLQREFPLVTGLLGPWHFNGLASAFLRQHPPRGHDLGHAGIGFAEFLAASVPDGIPRGDTDILPPAAVLEAIALDGQFLTVSTAPVEDTLRLAVTDLPRLRQSKLRPSRAVALVAETWPLLQLRRQLCAHPTDRPVALPDKHRDGRHYWILRRSSRGLHLERIDETQATLLRLLHAHPLQRALALFEDSCGYDEGGMATSIAIAERWLAHGIEHGFWTGIEEIS
jgi:hypothetical protein